MKKINSFIICVILSVMAAVISVDASGVKMEISVEEVTAGTSKDIAVPIKIANNKGICGMTIEIEYDDSLVLKDISAGTALASLNMTKPGDCREKSIKILWDGIEADTSNGVIAVLTFENPKQAGTYPIRISYETGGIIDGDIKPVEAELVQGSIIIKSASDDKDSTGTDSELESDHDDNGAEVTKTLKLKEKIVWNKQIFEITGVGKNASVEYGGMKENAVSSITIPDKIRINNIEYKITSIAPNAFKNNKKLTKVVIESAVTSIGANAFYGCKKLKTVIIGENVTSIGNRAFYKCTALKKITIPSKVSKIGKQAFYGCKRLKNITIKTTKLSAKKVGTKAFKNIYDEAIIKVPKNRLRAYKKMLKSKGVTNKTKIKK